MAKNKSNFKRAVSGVTLVTLMTLGNTNVGAEVKDETQSTPSTQPETTEVALTHEQQVSKATKAVEQANQAVEDATDTAIQTAQEVANATETATQAKEEVDVANHEVSLREEAVVTAENNDQEAQNNVVELGTEVMDAQSQVEQADKELVDVQTTTADTSIQLKKEVDNASDVVTSTVTETVKTIDGAGETNAYKVKNPSTPQEVVNYNGTATEDVVLSTEQSDELSKTGTFTYVPNVEAINKHFIDYVAKIRALNGIELPTASYSEQAQSYADARIQEVLSNHKKDYLGLPALSHSTKLGDERTFENLSNFTWKLSTDENDPSTIRVLSDKEFAYRIALGWFADYGNISSGGYGHRDTLLFGASDSQAISIGSIDYTPFAGVDRTRYYVASVGVDEEGKDVYEQYAQIAQNMRLHNVTVDPITNAYLLNGKQVMFLPQTTFNYIATLTKTEPSSAKAEAQAKYVAYLAQAQQLVTQAQTKADTANANLAVANSKLAQAQAKAFDTAQKVVEARQALADAVTVAENKAQAYEEAKAILSQAEVAHSEALSNVEEAKVAQANAVKTLEGLTGQVVETPEVPKVPEVPSPNEGNGGNQEIPSDNNGNTGGHDDVSGGEETPKPNPSDETPVDNGGDGKNEEPNNQVTPTPEPSDNGESNVKPIPEPVVTDNPFTQPIPEPNQNVPVVFVTEDPSGKPVVKIVEPIKQAGDNKVKVVFGGAQIDVDGVVSDIKNVVGKAVSNIGSSSVVKAEESTPSVNIEKDSEEDETIEKSISSSNSSAKGKNKTTKSTSKSAGNSTKKESSKKEGNSAPWFAGAIIAGLAGVGIYKVAKKPKSDEL